MATTAVITDVGREWFARFFARHREWVSNGWEPMSYHSWGEGGFEIINGIREPKMADNYTGNTDLEIVRNPGTYSEVSGQDFASDYRKVEWDVESDYVGGSDEIFQVTARLEQSEGNNAPNNPGYFELGIYDNAGDVAGMSPFSGDPEFSAGASNARGGTGNHHLMLYATFDGRVKTNNDIFKVEFNFPFNP